MLVSSISSGQLAQSQRISCDPVKQVDSKSDVCVRLGSKKQPIAWLVSDAYRQPCYWLLLRPIIRRNVTQGTRRWAKYQPVALVQFFLPAGLWWHAIKQRTTVSDTSSLWWSPDRRGETFHFFSFNLDALSWSLVVTKRKLTSFTRPTTNR